MERYSPHLKDLDCRDVVSRSIIMELIAGNGCGPDKDYVVLKLDHLGADLIKQRLPGHSRFIHGVSPTSIPSKSLFQSCQLRTI